MSHRQGHSSKRRFKRTSFQAPVAIYHQGRVEFGHAVQLSGGGMLVRARGRFQVGDLLDLNFFLPSGYITAIGEVAYSLDEVNQFENKIGIRFQLIAEPLVEKIKVFVDEKEPGQ